ncbi:VPS35 endosomal protein sorting factor-like [Scaptodrosophila lebanonensis]|uniref:VPS35 endosomal protein sorting factor-like n=1 Tax=Drosophila lebanonensis TaxID=7225 RepID=A0A6J2TB32_DROLE|nr:VPS35 endosomal protein sorting factor-like [Scaptodrosophila lebanonensis]
MASLEWICVPRCYEVTKNHLQGYETYEHPLKQQTVTVVDSKGTRAPSLGSNASSRSSSLSLLTESISQTFEGTDPLSQFARQELEFNDPLTQLSSEYELKSKRREKQPPEDTLNWSTRRLGILNRFTTNEKLSLSTSFLCTSSIEGGGESIKAQTVVADKVKYRLEQLDHFDDGSMRHMMDLTQQEYIQRFEQLKQELVQSWHSDQRVKALKIAIQCAKMLADTTVLQFYPSQFVLITDILDAFGKLVYERLRTKAVGAPGASALMLERERESAHDTCQNWFYKIASIRELLPRVYLEMAIFKCYEFLAPDEYDSLLQRLTYQLRGIADPLVSSYARCYLVRVGTPVTHNKAYIRENFKDLFIIYPQIFRLVSRFNLHPEIITASTYLQLYAPAFDFMLQSLVHKCELYTEDLLGDCRDLKYNGAILMSILNSYKPEFIASNALEFMELINNSNTPGISKCQLLRALGSCVSSCGPLQEQRVKFLNTALQTINTLTDPNDYINCVETWAPFVAQYFTIHEVNRFLGELNSRMCLGKAYEKHYPQLQSILTKIMQNYRTIELLLIQEHFLPYLDLFHRESVRVEVCKNILSHYKQNSEEHTCDAVVINALMYLGKILNDYVNALTVEDERRQIGQLINGFIHKVHFGRDLEQQLSFYVEARGTFSNLDAVYVTLVYASCKLAMTTRQRVQQHNRKTMGFVKACIAFCFITIPSIQAVHQQMDLYLLCGQVALINLCLGQADACFEAAISLVNELPATVDFEGKPRSMESYLVSYLCNMLATLVIVPDSPEQGVLYFLRLLLEVVAKYPFKAESAAPTTIYLHALDMLYVQSLDQFPYHIEDVVSNDALYGHDQKFVTEVNSLCAQVVDGILMQLKALGLAQQQRTQAQLSLELFLRIIRYADLEREPLCHLALNLWLLAYKAESQLDAKTIPQTLRFVEDLYRRVKESSPARAQCIAKLLLRMRNK